VLGVEDCVHGAQGDVLVARPSPVTKCRSSSSCRSSLGGRCVQARAGHEVGVREEDARGTEGGNSAVRDVIEELMIRPECGGGNDNTSTGRVALQEPAWAAWDHELRHPAQGPGVKWP